VNEDPGLAAHPWVKIEIADGRVSVDGTLMGGAGSPEDAYLAALQYVADEVATPLGRRVGVTVYDKGGVVSHLAVQPDGHTQAIEDLVREAAAPVLPRGAAVSSAATTGAVPAAPRRTPPFPTREPREEQVRRRWAPVGWAVAAAALVVGAIVAGMAITGAGNSATDDLSVVSADTTSEPSADPSVTPAALPLEVRWARPHDALVADVEARGPGAARVLVGATSRSVRATLTFRSADGGTLSCKVTLHRGITRVLVQDLPGGAVKWTVTARGYRSVSGVVRVKAPTMAPASQSMTADPPVISAPATTSGGSSSGGKAPAKSGGGGGNNPNGSADNPPAIPIDPDDQ
jgi:hypothetical protein